MSTKPETPQTTKNDAYEAGFADSNLDGLKRAILRFGRAHYVTERPDASKDKTMSEPQTAVSDTET